MRNDKLSMRLYNCENILLCSKIKKITKISKHHSIVNKETWRERGGKNSVAFPQWRRVLFFLIQSSEGEGNDYQAKHNIVQSNERQ